MGFAFSEVVFFPLGHG